MNAKNIVYVLRADGIFNGLAALALLVFYRPLIIAIGWPVVPGSAIYPRALGAALLGLAFAVGMAGKNPAASRDTILGGVIAKVLAGGVILWSLYLPQPPQLDPSALLTAAVGLQVVFAALEAVYWLASRPKM
jgi:hypothetical protein